MPAKTRRALIDGDELAFKAAVIKPEAEIDWGGGLTSEKEDSAEAHTRVAVSMLRTWTEKVAADEITLCFSPDDRSKLFRRDIFVEYKNGRTDKPPFFWDVVRFLKARYESVQIDGFEADDVMGVHSAETEDEKRIVVSSDKDLRTVPCTLYDPYHDKITTIRRVEADRFWMYQTLAGDPTDGFSGCPGVGKVGAEAVLKGHTLIGPMWAAVVQKYLDKKSTKAEAFKQATLARILRPSDWDPTTRTIEWRLGDLTRRIQLKGETPDAA